MIAVATIFADARFQFEDLKVFKEVVRHRGWGVFLHKRGRGAGLIQIHAALSAEMAQPTKGEGAGQDGPAGHVPQVREKVRGLGFEPRTSRLKAECSTSELTPLAGVG